MAIIRKMKRNIIPEGGEFIENYYAKGLGDPSKPLPLTGAMVMKAGEVYSTFTGFNAIILTKMCGVSINKSIIALMQERTAIDVSDTNFEIVLDRTVVVLTAKFN